MLLTCHQDRKTSALTLQVFSLYFVNDVLIQLLNIKLNIQFYSENKIYEQVLNKIVVGKFSKFN